MDITKVVKPDIRRGASTFVPVVCVGVSSVCSADAGAGGARRVDGSR